MASSEVSICNDALIMMGQDLITSLSSNNKAARLCNEQYPKARDQLLAGHPWNFAMTRVELTELSEMPSGWDNIQDFAYAFTVPTDSLRVWTIDDENEDWAVENGYLFANYTPVQISYIKKITTVSNYPPHFDKVLALDVALKVCYALTQSPTLVQALLTQREAAIREARSFDAQEMAARNIDASDFLNSRL